MTAPKAVRRRRRGGSDGIPADLAAWFAGEPLPHDRPNGVPWSALIWPDYALLGDRWAAWKEQHPGATPPAGWEWIDDPASKKHSPQWIVKQARALVARCRIS